MGIPHFNLQNYVEFVPFFLLLLLFFTGLDCLRCSSGPYQTSVSWECFFVGEANTLPEKYQDCQNCEPTSQAVLGMHFFNLQLPIQAGAKEAYFTM